MGSFVLTSQELWAALQTKMNLKMKMILKMMILKMKMILKIMIYLKNASMIVSLKMKICTKMKILTLLPLVISPYYIAHHKYWTIIYDCSPVVILNQTIQFSLEERDIRWAIWLPWSCQEEQLARYFQTSMWRVWVSSPTSHYTVYAIPSPNK